MFYISEYFRSDGSAVECLWRRLNFAVHILIKFKKEQVAPALLFKVACFHMKFRGASINIGELMKSTLDLMQVNSLYLSRGS